MFLYKFEQTGLGLKILKSWFPHCRAFHWCWNSKPGFIYVANNRNLSLRVVLLCFYVFTTKRAGLNFAFNAVTKFNFLQNTSADSGWLEGKASLFPSSRSPGPHILHWISIALITNRKAIKYGVKTKLPLVLWH